MFSNTSRVTGESSCCWARVATIPDTAVTAPRPTPMPRAICDGLMRFADGSHSGADVTPRRRCARSSSGVGRDGCGRAIIGAPTGGDGAVELQGRVVVVTGGASGIGRSLALAVARAGARAVVVADLD